MGTRLWTGFRSRQEETLSQAARSCPFRCLNTVCIAKMVSLARPKGRPWSNRDWMYVIYERTRSHALGQQLILKAASFASKSRIRSVSVPGSVGFGIATIIYQLVG